MTKNRITASSPGFSAQSYWMPEHFVQTAWAGHAPFASWLMGAITPSTVVELGTHNGFSFFVMAETARRLELTPKLYAIDTWAGDDHAGFYSEAVYESVRKICIEEYPATTTMLRSLFSEAVDSFGDGSIDLLHIDGRHGYDDVKEDYELYRPKLSDRAVVIFHDTTEKKEGFGVYRFWDELSATAPSFTFHHSHGLGVLAPGPRPPQAITEFLAAANADPDAMRAEYSRLGDVVYRLNYSRVELPGLVEQLQEDNAHLAGDLGHSERLRGVAEDELASVRNSFSWKVTKPVRGVRALARGSRPAS